MADKVIIETTYFIEINKNIILNIVMPHIMPLNFRPVKRMLQNHSLLQECQH